MGSIITDEHPASRAIIVEGVGPQLRIYCRYGKEAVEEGDSVDVISWNPTAGDWTMHVPCDAENIECMKNSLSRTSPRVNVFDVAEDDRADYENLVLLVPRLEAIDEAHHGTATKLSKDDTHFYWESEAKLGTVRHKQTNTK